MVMVKYYRVKIIQVALMTSWSGVGENLVVFYNHNGYYFAKTKPRKAVCVSLCA